jgi:hypothetical protein
MHGCERGGAVSWDVAAASAAPRRVLQRHHGWLSPTKQRRAMAGCGSPAMPGQEGRTISGSSSKVLHVWASLCKTRLPAIRWVF